MERPRIVVGLGNPGSRYRDTRHNLGFRVVDRLAWRWGVSFERPRGLQTWIAEVQRPEGPLVLAKPKTFMNRSGRAALALCERHAAEPSELFVVYDDVDLELGRIRLRPRGGAGGHNGVRSMIDALHSEGFPRLRLGVRGETRDGDDLADYVLAAFEPDEIPVAEALVDLGAEAVEAVLEQGLASAMNSYNARSVAPDEGPGRTEEEG